MQRKNTKFAAFGSWLRNSNPLVFSITLIAIAWVGNVILSAPVELGWVDDIVFVDSPLENESYTLGYLLLSAVLIAPLLETLLFQLAPFWLLRKANYFREHRFAVVLIGGLLFSSMHYYSVLYMVITLFMGMLLMYGYTIKWRKRAYWNVTLMHAFWNLQVLLIDQFME